VHGNLQPDLTLLLDASADAVAGRLAGRTLDRFERERREFFERVRAAYRNRAREHSRCVLIDANRPLRQVQVDITLALTPLLQKAKKR